MGHYSDCQFDHRWAGYAENGSDVADVGSLEKTDPRFAPLPRYWVSERESPIARRLLELTYSSRSLEPFARDLGFEGPSFAWDEERRAVLRADLDAFYARAYGLSHDELRYILDPADVKGPDYPSETFRVLMEKEIRRHGEYRTRRLVLAAWDRMEADGTFVALGMAAEADPPFPAGAMTAFSIAPIRNTLASSNRATSSSSTQSKFCIL